jgi:regulator of protease activity HflC (stomatin/prohibitin superfamily)
LRNLARDAFNEVGGQFTAEEMNGPRKEEFLNAVKAQINKDADAFGVVVEQFGLVGNLDLPSTIVDALNAKIAATQNAIRAENELRQAEAEAKKTVAKANGEAEANRVLTASLTPTLIQWQTLQVMRDKWNGALPQVSSGNGNFLYQLSH